MVLFLREIEVTTEDILMDNLMLFELESIFPLESIPFLSPLNTPLEIPFDLSKGVSKRDLIFSSIVKGEIFGEDNKDNFFLTGKIAIIKIIPKKWFLRIPNNSKIETEGHPKTIQKPCQEKKRKKYYKRNCKKF